MEPLGTLDQFPGYGNIYRHKGFIVGDSFGGPEVREWLDKNFEAKEEDTYVVSYPKTGTTWAQELVYLITNNLDFEKAKAMPISARFPYLELKFTIDKGFLLNITPPRFIKSHYPYSLLPQSIKDKKCKMVYTIRNPKDTVVSFYYFMKLKEVYIGDFKHFFDVFIDEDSKTSYNPFWKHLLEFWDLREQENILILHYEDMQRNIYGNIDKIASFFGKTLTDDEKQQVAEHCSFTRMKENPSTNYVKEFGKGETEFMRKGIIGDWKSHFTNEMNERMDAYIEKHFAGTGLEFIYE